MTAPKLCDHCGRIVSLNPRTRKLNWHNGAKGLCPGRGAPGIDLPPDVVMGEPRDRHLAGTGVMP